jgi:putative DNA primase/helicase
VTFYTVERARGHWREILPLLGVETRYLTNKHGPCPICGGKDRFRFDDRDGSGSYFCNQCGAGVGLILVRKLNGWDHRTACDAVDKILGSGNAEPAAHAQSNDRSSRLANIERLLREACHPDVVAANLRRRGLSVSSPVLRGHWRCPYYDDERKLIGIFPAVIAPITGADVSLQSLQRIYTGDLGERPRKKTMPPVDTISGAAVRLFKPGDELGIAEGVENALAAYQLFNIPVWATLFAENLKRFEPPAGISGLHVFADNDGNYTGQEAAFRVAHRLSRNTFPVKVHVPPDVGTDWLDVLNRAQRYDQA